MTNPPATACEMRHQASRTPACVRWSTRNVFGKLVEEVLPDTRIEYLGSSMGDLLPGAEGLAGEQRAKSAEEDGP